jgi:hypothetical protein
VHRGRVHRAALCVAVGVLGLAGYAGQAGFSSPVQPVASFGNADRDRTVTVHRGQAVEVALDTTNWQFDPRADVGVIRWQPQVVATGPENCTVLGQCGSVSIAGMADRRGRTTVHASREKCGELRRCDPSASSYRLTIVVLGE